jgi:hypothetical protein
LLPFALMMFGVVEALGVIMVIMVAVTGLLVLQSMVVLASYALAIPAPTKNKAWLWAVLALIFGVPGVIGYIVGLAFPLVTMGIGMTVVFTGWFCYILYLKSLGEDLKIGYVTDECLALMRLLMLSLFATLAWNGVIGGYFLIVKPNNASLADAVGTFSVVVVFGGICGIGLLILGGIALLRFLYVVMNLRLEIGWRLES